MIDDYLNFYQEKTIRGGALLPHNLLEVSQRFEIDFFELIELLQDKVEPHIIDSAKAQKFNIKLDQYLTDYLLLKKCSQRKLAEVFKYSNASNCYRCLKKNSLYRLKSEIDRLNRKIEKLPQSKEIRQRFPVVSNFYKLSNKAKEIIESLPNLRNSRKYKSIEALQKINDILDKYLEKNPTDIAKDLVDYKNACDIYSTIYLSEEVSEKLEKFFFSQKRVSINGVTIFRNKLISYALENHDQLGITGETN